eukprot:TRINITY_DN8463_c0_g1_i5.p1 TRINITY_DN8463_c0_g1~~TRINITY_DN8463_c0_g1_i5.p1  ORF type:complete len:360 (+),score=96.67 TRINITY_DN8463_c0_g1_i5:81-1160(+)
MAGKPSSASLIDLRAELARKQAQFRQEKQNPELKDARVERQRARQAAAWLKSNKGVLKRSQQDLIQNAKDTKSLLKVEAALKAKTALYEKLRQGQMSDIEQERYLVDFEQKFFNLRYRETEAERDRRENADNRPPTPVDDDEEDEWVDFVDEFGRNRRCLRRDLPKHNLAPSGGEAPQSQQFVRPGNQSADARTSTSSHDLLSADMQRDMARQAWEEREREALEKSHHGPVHYETVREKEVRNLGTAYFQFSTDAEQREEQMSTLNSLRDQTQSGRVRAQRLKERREQAKQQRLAKIRQRKGLGPDSHLAQQSQSKTAVAEKDDEQEDDLDSFLEHAQQHSVTMQQLQQGEPGAKVAKR